MATFYCKSGSGVLDYNAANAYSTGDRMVPAVADAASNHLVAKRWVWECTTGGTTNGAATWPAAATQDVTTITQNGVVFTARKPGFSSGSTADWTFATPYLQYTGLTSATVSGDTVYVSNNHAETQSAAYDCRPKIGVSTLCVNDSAAPPTALATTATITTTGNSTITYRATECYSYGLNFIAGSGASGTASISIGGGCERCSFQLASTGASSVIALVNAGRFANCDVKFGAAGQGINGSTAMVWSGGSLLAGGTSPTIFILSVTAAVLVENFDFTNAGAGINLCGAVAGGTAIFRNITLPASWSGALGTTSASQSASTCGWWLQNYDVASGGTNYQMQHVGPFGTEIVETTIVRTNGATDGTTPLSWKMATTASAGQFPGKFIGSAEIVKYNATTGSAITVACEIVHDSVTALTDAEVWLEVSYLGTAGAPLGTLITDAAASVLATPADQTTSSATWTTTGMSNPNKQTLSVTFTPQLAGYIHAVVKICKASKTVYVDPLLTVA